MSHLASLAVILFQQSQPYQSPMPGLLIVLTIVGAVADYKYKKAGGQRPSRRDRILFLVMVLVIIGFVVWEASISPEIAGRITVHLVILTLFLWEVRRWRMRRKYPLA
jgi:Flp pilus assembly protein TadB